MSDDTVDMDTRRRLADRVNAQLKREECETGIDWFQTDERATVTSYSPAIVRQLLRHREARLCWIYATGGEGPSGRVQNPSQLLDTDASVEGVQVTIPVGTLGIKGTVRSENKDSKVVNTPADADEAREAFTDGGVDTGTGNSDPRTTAVCPECDSSQSLYKRKNKTPTWVCWICGGEFDEVDHRPPKVDNNNTPEGGSELLDLDPDEVP